MKNMLVRTVAPLAVAGLLIGASSSLNGAPIRANNVIIFVADGLRSEMISPQRAPEMWRLREEGVDLRNSHSVYPTLTTPNASAIAIGRWPGDTGDFGNILYIGRPTSIETPSTFAAVEDDQVLGKLNALYNKNYLGEASLMAAARSAGFSTASVGKLGPVGIQDVTERMGQGTVIIDDLTGQQGGFPLQSDIKAAFARANVAMTADDRGLNGSPGDLNGGGVWVANTQQQDWFTSVADKVLLPLFKRRGRPFFMVFWSRDPDGTQHFQGDSLNALTPGINGATSLAAIRNADNDLGRLRATLKWLGLDATTDLVVLSDHGFSTASKRSGTSAAAHVAYADVPKTFLPPGFLAIDLAAALHLPLADGAGVAINWRRGEHGRNDGALLGRDPHHPQIAVAANGGSDLIYLPGTNARELVGKVVETLTQEDYTAAIFVDDRFGPIRGALPMSAVNLKGHALTPEPAIIVSFRSYPTGCAEPELCAAEVADTSLQQGQGAHGSFSRADTHNVMVLAGPDFRRTFLDPAPASNADIAPTLAHLLHLSWPTVGGLQGRVLQEALPAGNAPDVRAEVLRSLPAANGFVTVLDRQSVGGHHYFDAAGAPGRVVGLHE